MRIGIIGTGDVGASLAHGFVEAGHSVVLGSRNPDTANTDTGEWAENVDIAGQLEAAEKGDVVVLALPADVVTEVAADLSEALAGKPVIDPTNEYPTEQAERSVAERLADAVPGADVVKAFNTIGAEHMMDPVIGGETATMFIAGEDGDALNTVEDLATDLGFEVVVAHDLSRARRLEDLARFWIDLANEHGRDVGFRLIRG